MNAETTYRGRVAVGNVYEIVLPWSEVCDHMKLAGKLHPVLVAENGCYVDAGAGPHVTHGEAGIHVDSETGEMSAMFSVWAEPGGWAPADYRQAHRRKLAS